MNMLYSTSATLMSQHMGLVPADFRGKIALCGGNPIHPLLEVSPIKYFGTYL